MQSRFIALVFVSSMVTSFSAFAQTHLAVNDDDSHWIGTQGKPGAACEIPLPVNGVNKNFWVGDDNFADTYHQRWSILSFDMQNWLQNETYELFLTEANTKGNPFEDLGKVIIEFSDISEPYPDRYNEPMTLLGTFGKDELFNQDGIDISSTVQDILNRTHSRYLYLRFRFEVCFSDDGEEDRLEIATRYNNGPENAPRIVQGTASRVETTRLYFSQFADGGLPPSTLSSQIVLVNLEPFRGTAQIRFTNSDGTPMNIDINGTEVDGEMEVTIDSDRTLILATDGVGELQTGSVSIVSDLEIGAVVVFSGSLGFAGVTSSEPLREAVIPIQTGSNTNTGLAFMGLGKDLTLSFLLRSRTGTITARASVDLKANGHQAIFVNQLEWSRSVDFSDFTGKLNVSGTENFAAIGILTRPNQFATLPVLMTKGPE